MAGAVMPLFTLREFDFSSGNATVIAVRSIDTSRYDQGVINVRVHSNSITSGTGTIAVHAKPISLTSEDPSSDFIDATTVGTASVANGTAALALVRGSLSTGFGGALQITVVGTKGTSTTVKAKISAELVLKD